MLIIFIVPLVVIGLCWYQNEMFKKTSYHKMTKYSFGSIVHDRGRYGEYLTYRNLRAYEYTGGKFGTMSRKWTLQTKNF